MASRPGPGPRLDVFGDQLVDEVQAGLLVLAAVALGRVRRQQVPLCRAGAQRARRDHLEAGLQQVVPVLDVLRVALADDQRNRRAERDALGGVGVPVLGHLVRLDQAGDVGFDGEVDDVGGLAVDDGPGLVTRGAVGRGHGHALALVGGRERRDDLAPARFGHRVGDQGQRGFGAAADRRRRRRRWLHRRTPRAGSLWWRARRREARFCGCSLMTFPCCGRTGVPPRRKGEGSVPGHETAATDTKPRTGWDQRQQQTSATAQLPTAMRATMWPSLPDAACMARRITESRNDARSGLSRRNESAAT